MTRGWRAVGRRTMGRWPMSRWPMSPAAMAGRTMRAAAMGRPGMVAAASLALRAAARFRGRGELDGVRPFAAEDRAEIGRSQGQARKHQDRRRNMQTEL